MKTFNYILMLFFLGSCSAAQNYQLIEATHSTNLGGVKGARSEKFEITVKENPKLLIKHLLIGNVKVALIQKRTSGLITLSGLYFPEQHEMVSEAGQMVIPAIKNNLDFNKIYLVSEDIQSKKEILQKIIFSEKSKNMPLSPTEDVPQ